MHGHLNVKYLDSRDGFALICSENLPEVGIAVPKLVGV